MGVDDGCGSGQSARELCQHFNSVIGMDKGESQLAEAIQLYTDDD